MKDLYFWKHWNPTWKLPYQVGLVMLFVSILVYYIAYFVGVNAILQWIPQTEVIFTPIVLDSFYQGLFPIEVSGSVLLLQTVFSITPLRPNAEAVYALLSVWSLVLSLLLTIFTFLKRLWYSIGIGITLFFLATLQLDTLGLVGNTTGSFYILVLLYLPLSYYFQAFNTKTNFIIRFIIFLFLTLGVGIWIYAGSKVVNPLFYVVAYASTLPIALTLIFMTIVAHDLIYVFVYVSSNQSNNQKSNRSLLNFIIITSLYLGNLILLYMERTAYLQLDLFYIEPFWFFPIAILIGIWGYRRRSELMQNILPFEPFGAFFYLSLAILSLSTIAYYFVTANDSVVWVLDNFLLYSHISFGAIFVFYIFINFSPLFQEGLPVYKVVYQGDVFSFRMYRFVGFAVLFIFFMQGIELSFFFLRAGYFNSLADASRANQELVLAEEYYLESIKNDYLGHRSRYSFAELAENEEIPAAILSLYEATQRNPTTFTYGKLGELYWKNNAPTLSIAILREGVEKFPESVPLLNNLAVYYARQDQIDSAYFFLQKAQEVGNYQVTLQNNDLTFLAKKTLTPKEIDSLFKNQPSLPNVQALANWTGLFNIYKQPYTQPLNPSLFSDTLLNDEEFVYLYNYTLNQISKKDEKLLKLLENLTKREENAFYRNNLQFLSATKYYYQGKTATAINLMTSITSLNTDAYYNRTLALWLLEQEAFPQAVPYFKRAVELYDFGAVKYLALALTGAGEKEEAIKNWEKAVKIEDGETKQTAQQMLAILQDSSILALDTERFWFIKYGKLYFSENRLQNIWEEIREPNYKVWAASELIQYFLDKGSLEKAKTIYIKINDIDIQKLGDFVKASFYQAFWSLLLAEKDYATLLKSLDNQALIFPYTLKIPFFRAEVLKSMGKYKEAEKNYFSAQEGLPYKEEIILASAQYFEQYQKNTQKAYEILAKAVQLNPYSLKLYQAYALQALKVGLTFYGDNALQEIQRLSNEADYQAFLSVYQAELLKQQEKLKNF